MKPIYLGRARRTVAWVDDEDYEWLSQWQWSLRSGYAGRRVGADGLGIMMHRQIMGCPEGMVVDHINGDRLMNVRSNLRVCTQKDNSRNAKRPKSNDSGYMGVSRYGVQSWRARITVDVREEFLGSYSTVVDAAKAYNAAAVSHFGEFARLNLVDGGLEDWGRILADGLSRYKALLKTSRYDGVSFCKQTGRWRAAVTIGGTCSRVGRYDSEEEAAYVVDQIRLQIDPDTEGLNIINKEIVV